MTNFGFLGAMEAAGIEVEQTNVGDRYVLEAILKHEWNLGASSPGTSSGPTSPRPGTGSRRRC